MLKALGWLAIGLVAGAVAMIWLRPAADFPQSSASAAFASGDETAPASTVAALVDRVAALEGETRRLMTTVAALSQRLSAETARANSAVAASTAAVRELEQRMAAAPAGDIVEVNTGDGPAVFRFAAGMRPQAITPESVAAAAASGQPMNAPANLRSVDAMVGTSFVFRVTGSTQGSVWGTDIYTDDSSIAAAAVHSGALQPNETGTVMVTVHMGYPSYRASSRYGVESDNFGEWERSYAIQRMY
jgi:hypothetical protein